jgi:hypothetical protein
LTVVATFWLMPASVDAADPGKSGSGGKSPAVTFESIPGSTAKRVILTAKAAERLGIETGKVGEEPVLRRQMVSGLIIPPREEQAVPQPGGGAFGGFGRGPSMSAPQPASGALPGLAKVAGTSAPKPAEGSFGGFGARAAVPAVQPDPAQVKAPATGEVWVLVTLSPAEWDRLAKNKPARLLHLATRDKLEYDLLAQPTELPPVEDMKRSMLSVYYVVPGKDHGLTMNNRMRVELQVSGSDDKQKVVPYSAVYYDGKGTPWVYINPKPLEFERKRIRIERVVGDVAVLSEGPPIGVPVVTVGAALLYGAEIFGK